VPLVGYGSGCPKDVFVEVWVYNENGTLVAYASKFAN